MESDLRGRRVGRHPCAAPVMAQAVQSTPDEPSGAKAQPPHAADFVGELTAHDGGVLSSGVEAPFFAPSALSTTVW
jgi:hypothetical protein